MWYIFAFHAKGKFFWPYQLCAPQRCPSSFGKIILRIHLFQWLYLHLMRKLPDLPPLLLVFFPSSHFVLLYFSFIYTSTCDSCNFLDFPQIFSWLIHILLPNVLSCCNSATQSYLNFHNIKLSPSFFDINGRTWYLFLY